MTDVVQIDRDTVRSYLATSEEKDLLRFLTAGSVDDGKSTLIGRLLADTGNVFIDQVGALERDSQKHGNAGDTIDYSLLVDGLKAEREQGITIDVAYRYFSTAKRKFIIADTPGHEQYTRNMATGASTAELAVILIDARYGVLSQTKRHSFIATLLGIRHLAVCINKMDLVDYDQEVYERIQADYLEFAGKLPPAELTFIPVSALEGENVVAAGKSMPWYQGPSLLQHLESVEVNQEVNLTQLLYPVQYVLRPNLDFRGYCGTLASGLLRKGQEVTVLPSGKRSRVRGIHTFDGDIEEALPPQSVCVTLEDELDVSRGDVLVHEDAAPRVASSFMAMCVWMHETPLEPGRSYLIKQLCSSVPGSIAEVVHQVDVNTLEQQEASDLGLNEIGKVRVRLSRPVVYDLYRNSRQAGAFIIIDRVSNNTVGAGMISDHVAVETGTTRHLLGEGGQPIDVISSLDRASRFNQRPASLWISGVSGSSHQRIAQELERQLFAEGYLAYVLDFTQLSLDMRRVLGFSADERLEDLRRAVALTRLCTDIGVIAIAVIGDTEEHDESVRVYLDERPWNDPAMRPDQVEPAMRLPADEGDVREAARRIGEMLRHRGVTGFYRGDDIVSI